MWQDNHGSFLKRMKGVIMEKTKIMNPVLVFTGWLAFIIGLIINPYLIGYKVFLLTVARVLPYGLKIFFILEP